MNIVIIDDEGNEHPYDPVLLLPNPLERGVAKVEAVRRACGDGTTRDARVPGPRNDSACG